MYQEEAMKAQQAVPNALSLILVLTVSLSPLWAHGESTAGALDEDFGDGGRVLSDLGGGESMRGAAIQPDGNIVVVGSAFHTGVTQSHDVFVTRYDANGVLDPTFGTGGFVHTDFGAEDSANDVVIQPDGNIVIAGDSISGLPAAQSLIVARYLPDGTLDPNFASAGKRTVDVGGFVAVSEVALDPQGRIVVLGSHGITSPFEVGSNVVMVRLNPDGSEDTTFDGNGRIILDLGGSELAASMVVLPDPCDDTSTYAAVWGDHSGDHLLFGITEDGKPDASFGEKAIVTIDLGFHDFADGLTMLPCGDFVASGVTYTQGFTSGSSHLIYFDANGVQQLMVDKLGKEVLGLASGTTGPIDVSTVGDDRVLVASSGDGRFVSGLFDPNGVLDHDYGTEGVAAHNPYLGKPTDDFLFFANSAVSDEFAILAGFTGNFNTPDTEDTVMIKTLIGSD
jgi:uncharacterized delta-60 repeat protein